MSLLSHEKQLITSLKKFAARIDDWLKADEKLPAVEAVSNDKTVAGDDDKKRRNSDSDDDDVFKPPQRKRTLFKNVSGVFDVESDDASSQPDFFSSTQKDDADFTVETTSSSSGSGKLREKEFLSPLPPPTRKGSRTKKSSRSSTTTDDAPASEPDPWESTDDEQMNVIPESESEDTDTATIVPDGDASVDADVASVGEPEVELLSVPEGARKSRARTAKSSSSEENRGNLNSCFFLSFYSQGTLTLILKGKYQYDWPPHLYWLGISWIKASLEFFFSFSKQPQWVVVYS